MRIPRTRGAVSGVILVLAGLWGGLIPLVGPSFDFGFTPDETFEVTEGRFYLSLLPGIATFVGGLILLTSAHRAAAAFGGWLALAGGVWFAIGSQTSRLWNDSQPQIGTPIDGGGGTLEHLAYFVGLGALVTTLAAFALGRLAVKAVRDVELERAHVPDRDRAVAPAPVSAPERDRPADDRDQAHDWIPSEAREQPTARPAESGHPAEPVTTSTRPLAEEPRTTVTPTPDRPAPAPERRGRLGRLLNRRR